ncbi:uncharacterized protein MELLADRAFT_103937 [Melampsora larici-populina 98AG31]|uniref:Uncharacterized protein n=1 Tax=Melampsora larici-populina (strain 98AG31 / pathotype 3-4-7) TaxID=747676 RepID=F4RD19_MELLP|nr:uncharacterized protein MELLADRAFT_103937 [Melampsora larici-populina 98AG31]EGG09891.1 hypothetical protein MELLADRAFT_103937 [Melampsora larici-populina 98AG31]
MDSNQLQDQIDKKLRMNRDEENKASGAGEGGPPPQGTNETPNKGTGDAEARGTNNQLEDPAQELATQPPTKTQPKGKAKAKVVGPIRIKPLTHQQEQIKLEEEKEAVAQSRLLEEKITNERAEKRIEELERLLRDREADESGDEEEMLPHVEMPLGRR